MAKSIRGGVHDRKHIYHFQHNGFDFMFQWLLGSQTHGGSEVGESFYAANHIKDGDPDSWVEQWTAMAERVEKRAKESMKNGHKVSARESYLRAYSYRRCAMVFMSPLKDARYEPYYLHARRCFRQGMALMEMNVESVEVPFEGKMLPGYFLRPDNDNRPRKTLVMIGGGDTFVEDLYYYIAPAALKRDYNLLIVDLPGQGILPNYGMPMRPDTEAPLGAVADYILTRPEVDPERLAVYGISAGGYLVPRAVAHERRFKASIACSMILDFYMHWAKMTKIETIARMENTWKYQLLSRLQPVKIKAAEKLIDYYKWRWGVKSTQELLSYSKQFTFDPKDIQCPTLIMVGEFEYSWEWSRYCQNHALETISNPDKKLIIMPDNEGADGHAIGTNLSLMSQMVFDWLDERLDPQPELAETVEMEPAVLNQA